MRIVPEFDLPGHCAVLSLGLPEMLTDCAPVNPNGGAFFHNRGGLFPTSYQLDVFATGLDELLDRFVGEMAGRFPGGVLHFGGDEVDFARLSRLRPCPAPTPPLIPPRLASTRSTFRAST